MRLLSSLLAFSFSTASLGAANLYHPGDFETHLVGGCYSSDTGVTLSTAANSTPGGHQSWELRPASYQHLELLVPGQARYRLSLQARSAEPFTIELKVITPGESTAPAGDTKSAAPKALPQEILHHIPLAGGDTFVPVVYEFETVAPYPGPIVTEILLGGYNPGPAPVFIDDLQIEVLVPSPLLPRLGPPLATLLRNADFESGLEAWTIVSAPATEARPPCIQMIDTPGRSAPDHALVLGERANSAAPATELSQTFPAADLAGRRVHLSAEVHYLSTEKPLSPWAAVLLVLENPDAPEAAQVLPSTPAPLWLPLGLAAPAGQPQTISAVFALPSELRRLRLRVLAQPGLGGNLAAIDKLTFTSYESP